MTPLEDLSRKLHKASASLVSQGAGVYISGSSTVVTISDTAIYDNTADYVRALPAGPTPGAAAVGTRRHRRRSTDGHQSGSSSS